MVDLMRNLKAHVPATTCRDRRAVPLALGLLLCALVLALGTCKSANCADVDARSNVSSDEEIIFFHTSAAPTADGSAWTIPVHGWIFEPEVNDVVRRAIVSRLTRSLDQLDDSSLRICEQRVQQFLVDNERAKRIVVRVGNETFELEPSAKDGHFVGEFSISAKTAAALADKSGWIPFEAVLLKSDDRIFKGAVQLVSPEGLLVISDIDDTVKVTEVTDKSKLIFNTFCREFEAVEGMAGVYRSWEKQGVEFVFVSGSPWQLYRPLTEFLAKENFPSASFFLKPFSLKDPSVAGALADPDEHKLKAIGEILARHPRRRVVLVGDSGERDPEIYGQVARENPDRIERIFIRRVTPDEATSERYQKAFEMVPAEKWKIFDRAEELPEQP